MADLDFFPQLSSEPIWHMPELPDAADELTELPPWQRRLTRAPPGILSIRGEPATYSSVEQARAAIASAIASYLEEPDPGHALVISAPPGTGKTQIAVAAAERLASQGRRVLYCAPRHDFWADIMALAQNRGAWYEWLPRQDGKAEDEMTGTSRDKRTCEYTAPINSWLARGYPGMAFCSSICGWEYVNKRCVYHGQRRRAGHIVMGQHAHYWLGHPLQFDVVIGDELPLSAVLHEWVIPARFISSSRLSPQEPIAETLHLLATLVESGATLAGPDLLKALGGVECVYEAVTMLDVAPLLTPPTIYMAGQVEKIDYGHVPQLVWHLAREAAAMMRGEDYPPRVLVTGGVLRLLGRRKPLSAMPRHTIWLDATANETLYRAMLGRSVKMMHAQIELRGRVMQIYDRANGVSSFAGTSPSQNRVRTEELTTQVVRIVGRYEPTARIGLITHLAIEGAFAAHPRLETGHFYAERGTNRLEDVAAIIIAGVPSPPIDDIEKIARMLFLERMRPFRSLADRLPWSLRQVAYQHRDEAGDAWQYPVGGFWNDPELAAVLWQYREAELLQAAHRARPFLRDVDVWLLANLPVEELPPNRLISIRELLEAPLRVDVFRFRAVLDLAETYHMQERPLAARDLVHVLGITRTTAAIYLRHLVAIQPNDWRWPEPDELIALPHGRGRPVLIAIPR